MTKTTSAAIFMAVLIMTATIAVSVNLVGDASAMKSKGTTTSEYGSKTGVCGVQLCSKYP